MSFYFRFHRRKIK